MHVDSVEPAVKPAIHIANASSAKSVKTQHAAAQPRPAETPPRGEPTGQDEPKAETENLTRERGVIRLLEQGHFKGVADVRLRINFFDELSSRANAAAAAAVLAGSGDLVERVSSGVQGLLDELSPGEDAQQAAQAALEEFQQAVDQATKEATTQSTPNAVIGQDALENAFRSAFDALLTALRTALPPPVPSDQTSEPSASDEETDDQSGSTVDLDTALNSLTQAFEEALRGLLESVETASSLPPLSSPPSGEGKAYDKFLAIYESLLQGGTKSPTDPPTDPPNDDKPIDVVV